MKKKINKKELEKKKEQARKWSLDPDNNIGEAVVSMIGRNLVVASDVSAGVEILATFINGKEVK